jgi:CHAT domain-containing protein
VFTPLPGTRVEGERIAALLGVTALFQQAVTEAALIGLHSPEILHVATHGFFVASDADDPDGDPNAGALSNPMLRSGLALAGANWRAKSFIPPPGTGDGLLTAEEVTGLDLQRTELVVMSACETGLGAVHAGEGVFGLRRAFVLAGARTLVLSLWRVPDRETCELMVDYYAGLLAGKGRAAALRDAQLRLRESLRAPFYWAAFICQGDPDPLPSGARKRSTDRGFPQVTS